MIIDGARFLRRRQSWSIVQVEILAPDNEKDTLSTALRERVKNHNPSEIWLKFQFPEAYCANSSSFLLPLHTISLQAVLVPPLKLFTKFFEKSIPPENFTSSAILLKIHCPWTVVTLQRMTTYHLPSWKQPLLSLQSNRETVRIPFLREILGKEMVSIT